MKKIILYGFALLLFFALPTLDANAAASTAKGDAALAQLKQRHGQFVNIVPSHVADTESEKIIIKYRVKNGQIYAPYAGNTATYKKIAQDGNLHKRLWEKFIVTVPASKRQQVTNFTVFTDGHNNDQAFVQPNDSTWKTWTLAVDYKDALDQPNNFFATLVHESAHLVSLNKKQTNNAGANCKNFTSNGVCMNKDSHLNRFYQLFWQGPIHNDWVKTGKQANQLYLKYPSSFVDQYAAASPEEDFAESFMYFVFSERPTTAKTRAEQKIAFFYKYDSMIHFRNAILTRLNSYY